MIVRRTLPIALAALILIAIGGSSSATADSTYFVISNAGTQQAGVDSYYVGNQVVLGYVVSAIGKRVHEVDFPTRFTFSNGNLVGPVLEGPTGFSFNPSAAAQFSTLEFDSTYGAQATDPDTLYWLASGGNGYGGTLAYLRFTPKNTGTITIDSTRLPSGVGISARDSNGVEQSLIFVPKTIWVVPGELRFQVRVHGSPYSTGPPLVQGVSGRFVFEVVSTGLTVGQISWPTHYRFSNGNLIGPLAEGTSALPGADAGLFDSVLWSGEYESATDPDTTLFRLVSNGGVYLKGTYQLWSIEFTPTDTGLIVIDSLTLPPSIQLSATDSSGTPLNVVWASRTVRVIDHFPSFGIATQLGNDTMFAHQEGSIIFNVNAAGWNLSAITMPIEFTFGGAGNLIGPITENPAGSAVFSYSAYAREKMENRPFNAGLGNAFTGDPDTLLFGALDFNGDGWDIDGELARITFTPPGAGTISIDSSIVIPASGVAVLDQVPNDVPYTWNGPYTITVLPCPVKMGDVNEDGVINTADLIYMVNYIFKSGPDPLPMRTVGDANCSGGLGGSDIIYLVNYIFKGGRPPCACYVSII